LEEVSSAADPIGPLTAEWPEARAELLCRLREARGFDVQEVAAAKLARLARFFRDNQLDAAVVGVSGGVDSALVLALLQRLLREQVLRRVVALLLPVEAPGATCQLEASARGRLVAHALAAECWEAPLAGAQNALIAALSAGSETAFGSWAMGQTLSVLRTPALYGAAALLQQQGLRSLVVGTTNRDEGSYLGFYGKASDGMVDLQPISDLHKSEVRALARHFEVPERIVTAVPRGEVHDGRSDEEMIGASYDDVELYLRLREVCRPSLLDVVCGRAGIERQHIANRHKYRVGSPAIHLDVLPRAVPGGAADEALSPRTEQRPAPGVLPGAWDPPALALSVADTFPRARRLAVPGFALYADGVLSTMDCQRLCAALEASGRAEPVGVTGLRNSYGIGSMRATAFSPELARALFERLLPVLPSVRFLDAYAATDAFATATRSGHRSWRLVGLSPLLRFMRYDPGGRHLCHYDAGFDYGDGRRSLLSVVFYLTCAERGGATRLVRDGQESRASYSRDFSDWTRDTHDEEVIARVPARTGRALVFDHRLCHDVERWEGPGARVIVRADVVYEAIPDGRG
jgi:NAD+ synthetase